MSLIRVFLAGKMMKGMMNRKQFCKTFAAGAATILSARPGIAAAADRPPDVVKNIEIFREAGKFAGWPANHGSWQWGSEMLFGFEIGSFKETERGHAIDYSKPAKHVLARSLDDGETWEIEEPASLQPPAGAKVAGVPTSGGGKEPVACPGGIDFMADGFALTARMLDIHVGPSRFYYTYDKGKTWEGPFLLPGEQFGGMAARTDYIVLGKHEMLLFVAVPKSDGKEGMPVVLHTKDGGKTWTLRGRIGEQPEPGDFAIMPASIRLYGDNLLTIVRHRQYLTAYVSEDMGKTWASKGNVVEGLGGNPPSLVRIPDGRLVLTYGCRAVPYGIRARISTDLGKNWGPELRIRTDAATWDLGYVRTFIRRDGNLLAVYYYNDKKSPERFIGGTVWYPGDLGYSSVDSHYREMEKARQERARRRRN